MRVTKRSARLAGWLRQSYRLACFGLAFSLTMISAGQVAVHADPGITQNAIQSILEHGTFYNPVDNTTACAKIPAATSTALPASIPQVWRDLIAAAAAKPEYADVDPRLVAAVLYVEHNGWPEYKEAGFEESNQGARGAFQFIPSTWFGTSQETWDGVFDESHYSEQAKGTDGDGDGKRDPDNPRDAVEAAFKHHRNSAGLTVGHAFTGNADADFPNMTYDGDSLLYFMGAYNGGGFTDRFLGEKLSSWPDASSASSDTAQNRNYVRAGYWLLASNFTKGWDYANFQFIDLGPAAAAQQGNGNVTAFTCNGSGELAGGNYTDISKMVYYGQCDERWGIHPYPLPGTPDGYICQTGCGPTSLAMIFATLTGNTSITPDTVADAIQRKGGLVDPRGTSWAAFTAMPPDYGLKGAALNKDLDAVKQTLTNGGLVIASMGPGHFTTEGHIIVIRAITADGKILVADPNDGLPVGVAYQKKTLTPWDPAIILSETSGFWAITK